MKKRLYNSISEIPKPELDRMMIEYAKSKAKSVRSARAYLRSIGVPINKRGIIDESVFASHFSY